MNASTCHCARGLPWAPLVGLTIAGWTACIGAVDPAAYPGSVQNPDGTYTYVFRPAGGANNGTDQGGVAGGKDSFVLTNESAATGATNYGAADYAHHFNSTCNPWRGWSYFQFDVSALPPVADVASVVLVVHQRILRGYGWPYQSAQTEMVLRAPAAAWNEMTLTYNNRPGIDPTVLARVFLPTGQRVPEIANCWFDGLVRLDVTELYRQWQTGERPNYGVVYQRAQAWCENANSTLVYTSDQANPALRPALEITYHGGVADTVPPVLQVPDTIEAEATGPAGAVVQFTATAWDEVDGAVPVECSRESGSVFPLGRTTVAVSAADAAGNAATASFDVFVRDTTPPVLTGLVASPASLAVPNHKMIAVRITAQATDTVDAAPLTRLVSVTSSEPVNGTGDGDTAPDWVVTGPLTVDLRAERAGPGHGRTYTIAVECADAAGNTALGTVTVFVPKNGKK